MLRILSMKIIIFRDSMNQNNTILRSRIVFSTLLYQHFILLSIRNFLELNIPRVLIFFSFCRIRNNQLSRQRRGCISSQRSTSIARPLRCHCSRAIKLNNRSREAYGGESHKYSVQRTHVKRRNSRTMREENRSGLIRWKQLCKRNR